MRFRRVGVIARWITGRYTKASILTRGLALLYKARFTLQSLRTVRPAEPQKASMSTSASADLGVLQTLIELWSLRPKGEPGSDSPLLRLASSLLRLASSYENQLHDQTRLT